MGREEGAEGEGAVERVNTGVYSVLVMEGTGGYDVYRGSKHTSTRA